MKVVMFFLILTLISCGSKEIIKSNNDLTLYIETDSIFNEYIKENNISRELLMYYETKDVDCSKINQILTKAFEEDQRVRQVSDDNLYEIDSINFINVISVYKKCRKSLFNNKLDSDAYLGFYLPIHHSGDSDISALIYNDFRKLVVQKKIKKIHLAVFVDRFFVHNGLKQFFGTQYYDVNKKKEKIYKVENLKIRREYMGFLD